MKHILRLILIVGLFSPAVARAAVIVGPPTFGIQGSGNTAWGFNFTADNHDSVLTGFDFHHNPSSFITPTGTITLIDLSKGNQVVFTTPRSDSPNDGLVVFSGLSILLNQGDNYRLQATSTINAADEWYFGSSWPLFPSSDVDISVAGPYFNVTSDSFSLTHDWPAFGNITTQPVPEPTLAIFGVMGFAGAFYGWRRKRIA